MRIISWNVNGLRAVERKGELKSFLKIHDPDLLLIQETKAQAHQLDFLDEIYPQYQKYYHSAEKAGYSGTGLWVKKDHKVKYQTSGFPEIFKFEDLEGRVIRADLEYQNQDYSFLGVYFPNGGKSEEAWKEKLVFYSVFDQYVSKLREEGKICFWGGDVNCAHHEIDLARPKENEGVIGFHPLERACLDKWEAHGWMDIWREKNPGVKDVYSWWHLITRSREKNVGWRIDYFFTDKNAISKVKDIFYIPDQMGSDHCPVCLDL